MVPFLKKIILFLTAFTFLSIVGKAQVPGYLGKRTVVGYGLYFNPAFGSSLLGYSDSPINALHTFFIERATNKKFAVGFSAQLYKYTYNNIEPVELSNGRSGGNEQVDNNPQGTYVIKGRNYSLYGKFFKWRYLAPWGKYFLLGLTLNRYETSYDPNEMKVSVRYTEYSPTSQTFITTQQYESNFGPTTQTYQKFDIFFGNGNSRIFKDKIVVDYGYSINVIAMLRIFLPVLEIYEPAYPETYVEQTSTNRVAAINRFNFYFKLGYLF